MVLYLYILQKSIFYGLVIRPWEKTPNPGPYTLSSISYLAPIVFPYLSS